MREPLIRQNLLRAFQVLDGAITQPLKLLVGGGAAMILEYGHLDRTRDVDAMVFQGFDKIEELKKAIRTVAKKLNLEPDWINPYFGTFTFVLPQDYSKRLRPVYNGK